MNTKENALIQKNNFQFLSSSILKLIACICMFIDHFEAVVHISLLQEMRMLYTNNWGTDATIYNFLRLGPGRFAFPIFTFLLIEGFNHTRSKNKYCLSLLLFALISEPFYDIAFYTETGLNSLNLMQLFRDNWATYSVHCNVYWTLLLGFLSIWCIETFSPFATYTGRDTSPIIPWKRDSAQSGNTMPGLLLSMATSFAAAGLAQFLNTDYGAAGVVVIIILYLFHARPILSLAASAIVLASSIENELFCVVGFLLCYLYNGKRGFVNSRLKYLFYIFYPAHLGFLIILRYLLLT